MGVSGCGKSTLAQAVSLSEGAPLIEGDQYHGAKNLDKMRQGIALTDDDRLGWLATLATQLKFSKDGVVMTCSALRRSYREPLRAARPGLRFVFMDIGYDAALARVAARESKHFFSASLVASQFDTLEPPMGEVGVLRVDACAPLPTLHAEVCAWLRAEEQA